GCWPARAHVVSDAGEHGVGTAPIAPVGRRHRRSGGPGPADVLAPAPPPELIGLLRERRTPPVRPAPDVRPAHAPGASCSTRTRRLIIMLLDMRATLAVARVLVPVGANAGAPADRLRLADVLAIAREENPAIRAARARAAAAATAPTQARAWDDPVVSWEAWNAPNNFNVAHADNNIFRVAQRIPFPGKRRLAGQTAADEARAAALGADAAVLDVDVAVKRAYWTLWRAHQRLSIYERQRVLAERFARVAEQRYATGGVPQSDVLRAQVELTHGITEVQTGALAIDTAR